MPRYIAEFVGTMILIILGDGVCCNVSLKKSGMNGAGALHVTTGWGMAVLLPAMIFGSSSGAHFNPVVTIGSAILGGTPWSDVLPYTIAQMLGAIAGACIVYVLFAEQFKATEDPKTKLGVFCTGPSCPNTGLNFLSEFVCGFLLVFTLDGIGASGAAGGFNWFLVYAVILSIGTSLGGLTGYAMNPARDLGPRMAHAFLPIPGKGDSNWGYAWIPVVAPVIGGAVAAYAYQALVNMGAIVI